MAGNCFRHPTERVLRITVKHPPHLRLNEAGLGENLPRCGFPDEGFAIGLPVRDVTLNGPDKMFE